MHAENLAPPTLGTTAADYDTSYYNDAHLGGYGDYSWDSAEWRGFFTSVAERIVGLVEPGTVLDVGCAKGMLVQGLVSLGVDARGSDISEYAVSSAHPDVVDRLTVVSATEPIKERYDLITCVEVLEHMSPGEAQKAIDSMCGATDRILFSSTPADFQESTHVNVHPTAQWAAWFAERGFYRRTDADVGFLTAWAILFERAEGLSKRAIVERYESALSPLHLEVSEKRHALLEANRRDHEVEETALARVAELEAAVARLHRQVTVARRRVGRLRRKLRARDNEIKAIRTSRSWRVGHTMVAPFARLKR